MCTVKKKQKKKPDAVHRLSLDVSPGKREDRNTYKGKRPKEIDLALCNAMTWIVHRHSSDLDGFQANKLVLVNLEN